MKYRNFRVIKSTGKSGQLTGLCRRRGASPNNWIVKTLPFSPRVKSFYNNEHVRGV
ncbi:MAG: hypothetical protein NZ954_07730 [Thermofilaceae archaeon]|nr:hypothetical protein [Thermofilaceae archaeon]MDW8004708.1 hypothetical protein [Thermofilaceae archaeon]